MNITRMTKILGVLALAVMGVAASWAQGTGDDVQVRKVVQQFEEALSKRDLTKIEPLMAADLVVLENGHRNDGWVDFRDNHLVPEMKEPMPPRKSEVVKVTAGPNMGWAYTKTEMQVITRSGEKRSVELWSVYILEKRGKEWKIALLDWSIRTLRPSAQ